MTFRTPELLWLLAIVPPALALLIARERTRERIARRFVSERIRGVTNPARPLRPWLIAAAMAAAVVALAGPRAGFRTMPIVAREANRIVIVDVSNSMAALDVGTSRLTAAKAIGKRIMAAHPGRVALVAFEGGAEVISPLTSDTDAVIALLDTLQPGEVEQPGSDLGGAILTALRLVENDPAARADIVIISDGEEQGTRANDAIQRAKAQGVEVAAVLIGTSSGAMIPDEGGPMRDEAGQVIGTYARADVLEKIARGTGGRLFENPFGRRALDPLLSEHSLGEEQRKEVRVPIDRYQWPLALAFIALLGGSLVNRGAE